MKQSLELKLGQRLAMTPQLRQAIKLLQMSAIDLSTEIQQALDENPLLEEREESELENSAIDHAEPADLRPANGMGDADSDESPVLADRHAGADDLDIGQWSEHFESHVTGIRDDNTEFQIEERSSQPTTLKDYLLWQMRMLPLSDTDREIATCLIDAIDEDGYLRASIYDLAAILTREGVAVDTDEIEATLHQIQNFDPVGVGARSLQECLLIQLRHTGLEAEQKRRALQLVESHFDLLCRRELQQLKRAMGVDHESLNKIIKIVQDLHPRPGSAIATIQPSYIIPDVIVKKVKNEWRVELNREAFPRLRINHAYQALLSRRNAAEDKKYIQNHLQEARWFIKSLDQRDDTLLRVARSIVERQHDFFEHGEEAMRPMVLNDISSALGLHESTISRATTHKYMLTPRGIFELKYFFSSHLSTADGGTCSSTAIRKLIRQFVERESPTRPISDNEISRLLGQKGIKVARRTVAKYRENMNIPASSQRKTLV